MNIDFKTLALFERVARLGAVGRAGAELGLSSSNASQRIQALEAELNLKLLNRTTRSVSLTPDGEVFLQYATRILGDIEDVRNTLSHNQSALKGRLRVTASSTFGRLHIVPYVAEFLGKQPELQLELNLTDQVVDIVREGYDLEKLLSNPKEFQ